MAGAPAHHPWDVSGATSGVRTQLRILASEFFLQSSGFLGSLGSVLTLERNRSYLIGVMFVQPGVLASVFCGNFLFFIYIIVLQIFLV